MQAILWAQSISSPFFDGFFNAVTQLGEAVPLLTLIFVVMWAVDEKYGWQMAWALCLASLVCLILKNIFQVERPWIRFGDAIRVIRQETATGYSFPSGHTTSFAAVAFAFALKKNKTLWYITSGALALLVAFSRLYCGAHTLTDVSVGLLLGAGGAAAAMGLLAWVDRRGLQWLPCAGAGLLIPLLFLLQDPDLGGMIGALLGMTLSYWLNEHMALQQAGLPLRKRLLKVVCGIGITVTVFFLLKNVLPHGSLWAALHYMAVVFIGTFAVNLIFELPLAQHKNYKA